MKLLIKIRKKFISYFLKTSPGWCEIDYLNDFDEICSERDFLLGWIIASIKNEFGFAAKIARKGLSATDNPLFKEMLKSSRNSLIKNLVLPLSSFITIPINGPIALSF